MNSNYFSRTLSVAHISRLYYELRSNQSDESITRNFMNHNFTQTVEEFAENYDKFSSQYCPSPLQCQVIYDIPDNNLCPSSALVFTRHPLAHLHLPRRRVQYELRPHSTWGLALLVSLPDHPWQEASNPETVYRLLVPEPSQLMMRTSGVGGGGGIRFTVSSFWVLYFSCSFRLFPDWIQHFIRNRIQLQCLSPNICSAIQ